ncbi:hypothetical protein AA103196_2714 [Ameyamaea chiangmaiensis NBRC 103196]|uniref:Uncharacterized protein n=1 Tax=Ameyamaea chiangmaiensis TaxID=442969 RepID=A0A850P3A3_9PROT|nr:hypothetical protein [Ameyamaea chiangmaiensis]MBS4074204.1 hypothetical protein [Ameyamaea chiangmaiensis]NVN39147.1 hypothetical protein [Ameyamaea chiangmaiensis]GBQ71238.1 hypothetical protein AA103196_2714 [Ameyamaea chiangmaiensis NBRC 103196]
MSDDTTVEPFSLESGVRPLATEAASGCSVAGMTRCVCKSGCGSLGVLRDWTVDRPLLALGVSAFVGLVLGRMIRRR